MSRGSSQLSYLLLMIRVIVVDMIPFFIVLVIFMITCSNALFILADDSHPDYGGFSDMILSSCTDMRLNLTQASAIAHVPACVRLATDRHGANDGRL